MKTEAAVFREKDEHHVDAEARVSVRRTAAIACRLSESGPVPNGVGEERGVPVFLRATHDITPQLSLHLVAGLVAVGGELRVENLSGNKLRQDDFDRRRSSP